MRLTGGVASAKLGSGHSQGGDKVENGTVFNIHSHVHNGGKVATAMGVCETEMWEAAHRHG